MNLIYDSYYSGDDPIIDWSDFDITAYLVHPTYSPVKTDTFSSVSGYIISTTTPEFIGENKLLSDQVVFNNVVGVVRTVVYALNASTLLWCNDINYPLPIASMDLLLKYNKTVFESPLAHPRINKNLAPIVFPYWTTRTNLSRLERSINNFFDENINQVSDTNYVGKIQRFTTMEPLRIPLALPDLDSKIEIQGSEHWIPSTIDLQSLFSYPLKPLAIARDYFLEVYHCDLYSLVSVSNASGIHNLSSVLSSNPITDTGTFIVVDSTGQTTVIPQYDIRYNSSNKTLELGFSPAAIYYQSEILRDTIKTKNFIINDRLFNNHYYNKSIKGSWNAGVPYFNTNYSSYRLKELQNLYPRSTNCFTKIALLLNATTYESYTVEASVALNTTDEVLGNRYRVFNQVTTRTGSSLYLNTLSDSDSFRISTNNGIYFNKNLAKGDGTVYYHTQINYPTYIPAYNSTKLYNEVIKQTSVEGSNVTKKQTYCNWDNSDLPANEFSFF